jgi:hypothetical protein
MNRSMLARLFIAIALTLFAGPLAFFNGLYGVLGVEVAVQEHVFLRYPGVLAGLVYVVLLFFSLGFTTCIVIAWRWYFSSRLIDGAP